MALTSDRRAFPRRLTEEESDLLRRAIELGEEGARFFLPQVDGMIATQGCKCGCPSIDLHPQSDLHAIPDYTKQIVSDLLGKTEKDESVGLILFQKDGKLSGLEIYSVDGEVKGETWGLPQISSLLRFEELSASDSR